MDALTVARFEEGSQATASREIAVESIEVGHGVATFFELGSQLNQAWNQGLHGPVTDDEVATIVAFFTERDVDARLHVCNLADDSLLSALARRGFVTTAFVNVFAFDLTTSPSSTMLAASPAGLTIEVVDATADDQVAEWALTASSGFHEGGEPPGAMLRASARMALIATNTALLARVDGEPAGAAVVSVTSSEDGIVGAGLFGTSVLPAYRRRGIQQQLMVERLGLAREHGARLATIASNPGVATERNAARFGFGLSYVKAVQSRPIDAQ